MKKFSFLNQFPDAVIVTNKLGEVVFQNNAFKRRFQNFSGLKKFSHNMNFDICPLNSENIEIYSPIYHALNSKEDFFAYVTFELSPNNILYFCRGSIISYLIVIGNKPQINHIETCIQCL